MPDYTKLTNLEVTGHLKVAGQEVPPGGGGGGGDFDAIVHYSHSFDTSDPPEITIERGTFATLYQKLNNGQTPTFLITYWDPILFLLWSTATVYIYTFDSDLIDIRGKVPTASDVSNWPVFQFAWNSDDTITWY